MRYFLLQRDSLFTRRLRCIAPGRDVGRGLLEHHRPGFSDVPGTLARGTDRALFGVAATLALDALRAPDLERAAAAFSWAIPTETGGQAQGYSELVEHSTDDPLIDAVLLKAAAPGLRTADCLAYRTSHRIPRRPSGKDPGWPFIEGQELCLHPRHLPQCAWPSVFALFPSVQRKDTAAARSVISMALAHSGSYRSWASIALQLELPASHARTINLTWRRLRDGGQLDSFLSELDALLEELLRHPPPINYHRRRWLFRDLPPPADSQFQHTCRRTGITATERRRRFTTMLVWETLTGGDVRLHHGDLCPRDRADRNAYAAFRKQEAQGPLAGFLGDEAERHLLRHRIDEPVCWEPRPDPDGGWTCPPPDLNRRLAGWGTASRPAEAQAETPRESPWAAILDSYRAQSISGLAVIFNEISQGTRPHPDADRSTAPSDEYFLDQAEEIAGVQLLHTDTEGRYDMTLPPGSCWRSTATRSAHRAPCDGSA